MNKKLMMRYLEKVSQMECQVYTLDRLYWELHHKSKRLGHPKTFKKPINPEIKWTVKTVLNVVWTVLLCTIPSIILLALASAVAWFAVALLSMLIPLIVLAPVSYLFKWEVPYLGDKWSLLNEEITPYLIPVVIVCAVICLIIYENKCARKKYQEDMRVYEMNVAADARRVQQELEVKAVLCSQREMVRTEYWAAKNALDALYGLDIIEKDYRDFAAVTTFYSYFRKEYCTRLAGPRQAYDRYDEALRIGEIINKLDVIIQKLDEISWKQDYLADLLRDSNNTLHRIERGNQQMLDSMQRMEENTELTEYNTRCAAKSSEVTELLTLYNTLKQNQDD